MAKFFRISLRYFKHVNADCGVEIIISKNKSFLLLNSIQNYFAPIITSASIITAPIITLALIPSIKQVINLSMKLKTCFTRPESYRAADVPKK